MVAQSRLVFAGRLAGTGVFDPNGDTVGKVADVVVRHALGGRSPIVVGIVVQVSRSRRVFVPVTRITQVEPGQVITTGLINVRRFEPRPGEELLLADMLDRQVTIKDGGQQATVYDLAIEPRRAREWQVAKVAVQLSSPRFSRRADTKILDWGEVQGLTLANTGQGTANLLAAMASLKAPDLAETLRGLTLKRRVEVAAGLSDERLADVFEELDADEQKEILSSMEAERVADILEEMGPDDAADLLGELPAEQAERLIELMEPAEAHPVLMLMSYSDDTAGGMMNPEPVILGPDATIAEALSHLRNAELTPALAAMVYVVRPPLEAPTGRFLGVAHFQRMLRVPPSSLVSAILDTDMDPLPPDASLLEVTKQLATYNLVAAPVVDDGDHLLGVVSVDDVLDHLLGEQWRRDDSPGQLRIGGPDGS